MHLHQTKRCDNPRFLVAGIEPKTAQSWGHQANFRAAKSARAAVIFTIAAAVKAHNLPSAADLTAAIGKL